MISKNIELIDLAILLKKENILIIADTHIGYEEALNKQGLLIPRFHFQDLIQRLEKILEKAGKLDKIVINGDIKHEFGKISETEWRHTLRLIDFLLKHCNEIILVKGNHDTILGPIAEKRKVKVVDQLELGSILILHGDEIPKTFPKNTKTIIIGHEHPAVSIDEGTRSEVFKCFLLGKYKDKELIVQPSFNLVTEGTDVTGDKLLSPFLKKIDDFKALVVGDKIYDFGTIESLKPQ